MIEWYNAGACVLSAVVNVYYFFVAKNYGWRWLKLMYGVNSIIVLVFTLQSLFSKDVTGARTAILLTTIIAGSIVSVVRNHGDKNGN